VTDFFGNVQNVELTKSRYPLSEEDVETEFEQDDKQQQINGTTVNKHLYHSFLVEKNNIWLQSIFGLLSTLGIGYVISTTIM
jgi:glycosylphosphatidylinositol transamidase (GPIT) subunit GPI8